MKYTFFVIDDDLACRRILAQIIEDEGLGEVIGELADGYGDVARTIHGRQPDVVLIDLLMPGKDGIEIVEKLKKIGFSGKIVMISQVEKKEMVAQAYAAGIEFYINKPVNRIEVISVIKGVVERLEMERSFARMRDSIAALDHLSSMGPAVSQAPNSSAQGEKALAERTREVLADMGLIGEPGSHDLIQIVFFLSTVSDVEKYLGEYRHLKELYQAIQQRYLAEEKHSDVRAIEQRVRRAIKHAMDHISALGLDDYTNPVFERYSAKFFDFSELRLKMKELEQDKDTPTRTRVNIKQFINALYWEVVR